VPRVNCRLRNLIVPATELFYEAQLQPGILISSTAGRLRPAGTSAWETGEPTCDACLRALEDAMGLRHEIQLARPSGGVKKFAT
jgi:hypothetical protein